MRTFIGFEGHYDIYDNGGIILRVADEVGRLTGLTKKLSNPKKINNDADRNGVLHLLQVMRVYKRITQQA